VAQLSPHAEPLARYLHAAGRTPFAYGSSDCGLWLADWIRARRGVDPGAGFRGTYSTEAGCARLVRRAGGLVALLDAAFLAAGLSQAPRAQLGDVGVIAVATARGVEPAGAIRTGRRWAVRARGGLLSLEAEALAIWRV
jgi:hypothetical protein